MTARPIEYAGYTDCVTLENVHARVVLGPQCGGRVLEYAWQGKSALALNPQHDGWVYEPGKDPIDPSGGRFDIGPETVIPRHPKLWLGQWEAEAVGPSTARMTSQVSDAVGTRLVREFTLAPESSRLTCTQTIQNVSGHETRWCHWSRTFGRGHGICVVPLTPHSRFPKQYVMYGPGPVINFVPDDPAIRVRDGFFEVLDTPVRPKLGLDSYAGWFAYLTTNDLMFVKQFPTYPDRVYNEIAGLTISLWYFRDLVCELEPIGPREVLAPGESASYTETWWLLPYPFPQQRDAVDLDAVRHVAEEAMEGEC